jgi:mono/diheme cytochrome c family protein
MSPERADPSPHGVRRSPWPKRPIPCFAISLSLGCWGLLLATAAAAAPAPVQAGGERHVCEQQAGANGASGAVVRGCYVWFMWTAGGETMWREFARRKLIDIFAIKASGRYDRKALWEEFGVINDPSCRPRTTPDEYGLHLDDCTDDTPRDADKPRFPGEPFGVVGLRKFPNPKFDSKAWNAAKYFAGDTSIEPPYLVGMTCAVCHASFNPLNPPKDPANPAAGNIVGTIGNIYLREGRLFTAQFSPDDFLWHYGAAQLPGTSDTSRIASDHIFNPNAINSIYLLEVRPKHPEQQADGDFKQVHMILKDGSDSIGTAEAALRVYVNIGMCNGYWLSLQDPFYGAAREQAPFEILEARRQSRTLAGTPDERKCLWNQTEALMGDVAGYLTAQSPPKLAAAPGGLAHIDLAPEVQARGRQVFAATCAQCHSSKRPPQEAVKSRDQIVAWFAEAVKQAGFLDRNFLSDDARHPVTRIGTNIARTLGTNPARGHIWDNFSSETYKSLPPVGAVKLYDWSKPRLFGNGLITFNIPGGGRGYYRTASLAGVWATAPLLHTNALGIYIPDPSVDARVRAFEDAMHKLLWPESRAGIATIMRTTRTSTLRLPIGCQGEACDIAREFPEGTPISLVMSTDPAYAQSLIARLREYASLWLSSEAPGLVFKNPDLVLDHGHTFGANLSDAEKQALIEYVKTF